MVLCLPRSISRLAIGFAGLASFVASFGPSCGGGDGRSPSGSTPPVTSTPAPTPPASGSQGAASCPLGEGSRAAICERAAPRLVDAVMGAMDRLVQQQPAIFDTSQEAVAGTQQYKVLDTEAYLNGLVASLVAAGYCAQRDPDDYSYERILVKNDNSFSETFDVLLSTGHIRRHGSYRETCSPASFPVERSGDLPPLGSGCGAPYPPPISRMTCKVHFHGPDYDTLDSTALVGHDADYCAAIGFTDGRSLCPVRPEGSPERVPCENWRVGKALDTGRLGPTWTVNGRFCTGGASGCENHPSNQHQLIAYVSGTYEVCAQTGACCSVEVRR
jgi:hypothetical protein